MSMVFAISAGNASYFPQVVRKFSLGAADKSYGTRAVREQAALSARGTERNVPMIRLTRRNGKQFVLNAELIKFVEEVPDTIVTLRDGEKVLIQESADKVVELALDYCRSTRFLPEPV